MSTPREIVVALRLQAQMRDAARELDSIADKLGKVGQAGRDAGKGGGVEAIGDGASAAKRELEGAHTAATRLAGAIKGAAEAGTSQSPFIAALREQIALYGKGTTEVLQYRAARSGVENEAAPLIAQLQVLRTAHEAAARAAMEDANAQRQAAAAQAQAASQRQAFLAGLREQVALQGKGAADVLRYRAGSMGIGAEAEQYIADIEKFEKATGTGGKALNRFGVTAGQTSAAMRMLPAQITDITTSIASGMPVWLVAIQQGGQIKDSFGGWAAAGDALRNVLTPTRLVLGALAAAVALTAVAFNAAQRDVAAYNRAVDSTGNYAGATRGQVEALAESAMRSSGITRGAARDAAVQMVQSGRLGIQVIGNLTASVQGYAAVTGQSTAAAAKSLTDMFVKPSEGAEKLNEQFHFLSLEQMRYIRQLEEQGQVEAARLELSERFAQHIGGTFVNNLGYLERAWNGVANAVKNAVDWMLKIGRGDTIEDEVTSQRNVVARLQAAVDRQKAQPGFGGYSREQQALTAAQERLAALEESKRLNDRAALAKSEQAQLEQRRIELDKKLRALADTLKNNREKLADEKKLLDEALRLDVIKKPDYDKLLAAAEKKFADPKKPPARTENTFLQQRQALTLQLAEAENKLLNARSGVDDSTARATTRLEAWLTANREAGKLTDAQVAELRKLAAATDAAAAAFGDLEEGRKRAERITSGMADVSAALATATGRSVDAAMLQVEERYRKLRADLQKEGKLDDVVKIDRLIDMTKAKAQLEDLRRQVELILGGQSRAEQSLQTEIQAGLTGELEGKQRLLDINERTAAQIEALLPRMRELASITGDTSLSAGVEDLAVRVAGLKVRADELRGAFAEGFSGSMRSALGDLARGTASLGDAVRSFVENLGLALADFAAQKLAAMATDVAMGGIDQALKAIQQLIPAFAQAASAKVAADQVMTASGVAATTKAAAVATAAGAEVAAANAPAAAATATWSWGAAAAAGLAALAAILALAKNGFDGGGYTGPGAKRKVAGVVHAGEYVLRQEVVRQPGVLAFMERLNQQGPRAFDKWPGYADGGLVGLPAAGTGLAAGYKPAPTSVNTNVNVAQRLLPVLDDELISDALRGPKGEELLVLHISRNPGKFRALLKV